MSKSSTDAHLQNLLWERAAGSITQKRRLWQLQRFQIELSEIF